VHIRGFARRLLRRSAIFVVSLDRHTESTEKSAWVAAAPCSSIRPVRFQKEILWLPSREYKIAPFAYAIKDPN
jgi:hypothetical protein